MLKHFKMKKTNFNCAKMRLFFDSKKRKLTFQCLHWHGSKKTKQQQHLQPSKLTSNNMKNYHSCSMTTYCLTKINNKLNKQFL